jgi:asparagine synthase (glutamine-hydrolysing)
MISDVPLGAFLSGGIDSSSVVALMAEQSSQPVQTFSIGFTEDRFDETRYARIVAERFGTEHREFRLSEQDVLDAVPTVLDHFDQPFGDSSALPMFLVCAQAREHVTVALAGDAADETFAGYRKYLGEYYYEKFNRLPRLLRARLIPWIAGVLPEAQGTALGERVRQVRRFLAAQSGDAISRHFEWMDMCPGGVRTILAGSEDGEQRARELVRSRDERSGSSDLNAVLYGDIHLCLPDDMFVKADMMSMYHALEVREPFTDHSVTELAAAMPASWKLHGTQRKHILVEAMRDLLPEEIRTRGKHGFVVPLSNWFRTALRPIFWDVVTETTVRDAQWMQMEGIRRLYDEHNAQKADHTFRLWFVFVYHWWFSRVRNVGI